MLGGFARVDRTPSHLPFRLVHRCTFCRARREETVAGPASAVRTEVTAGSLSTSRIPLRLGRTPKKRGPLRAVPVMVCAMVVRLRYVLSGQIRRAYFEQHRSIKEIVRTLSVCRLCASTFGRPRSWCSTPMTSRSSSMAGSAGVASTTIYGRLLCKVILLLSAASDA